MNRSRLSLSSTVAVLISCLSSAPALAQEPPPEAPPPPAAAPEVVPPPPPPVEPTLPKAEAEEGKAPPVEPIKFNFGVRVGLRLQDPNSPEKLSHVGLDTVYVEPRFSGQLTDNFAWQASFNGNVTGSTLAPAGSVGVLDLIAKFRAVDAVNVWAGRLLVPSDRSNFSGSFFMSAWNYPGFYVPGAPLGPKDGPNGRDNGAVIWGDFGQGKFKYYAGAFGLDQATPPYFSARLNLAIIGSEPGYYHSSTYYGSQDILAIGLGAQYQKDGSSTATEQKDIVIGMADVLGEVRLGSAGVLTGEAQVYKFNDGYAFASVGGVPVGAPEEAFFVLVSYLSPEVGVGKLQPLVRVQRTIDPGWTILDAFLSYVIKGYDLRVAAGYQRTDLGAGTASNALQIGIQLQR
jgi:hypothetical protein